MKTENQGWRKNQWLINWSASAFGVVLTGILSADWFRSKPFLTTFGEWWNCSWNLISFILNYEIKVWLLMLFVIFVFVIRFVINTIGKYNSNQPEYLKYTSGNFKGINWEWDYQLSSKGYDIVNLHPRCPICDTALFIVKDYSEYDLTCPQEDHEFEISIHRFDYQKIEILIWNNIKTKKFLIDKDSPLSVIN